MTLDASYRYCAHLTRAQAGNFFYTFWCLPPLKRRSIFAIYAFSRRLDDIADETSGELATKIQRLEALGSLLDPNVPTDDELAPALRDTTQRFEIPDEPFRDLIAGMLMDLEGYEYKTFEDLRLYCYRAASTVGLICIEIFGYEGTKGTPQVTEPAVDLGLAMQLTNILRDVAEDVDRERIYIPADERDRFGVTPEDLRRGQVSDGFRSLMRYQMTRARDYFRRSEPLFAQIDRNARPCPVLLARFYSRLLDQIEASNYDVFRRRPKLSRFEKVTLAARAWIQARMART